MGNLLFLKPDPTTITIKLSFFKREKGNKSERFFFYVAGTSTDCFGHVPQTEVYQHYPNY